MDELRPSRRLFDGWSRVYDNPMVQAFTYRPVQNAVVAAVRALAPERVLDVGCGTGLLTARLRTEFGIDTIGCDYSRGMLEQAKTNSPELGWVQGDAMALPIAGRSINAIVCTESFHWYPDQARALVEFARVLQPGGRAYIALVNPPSDQITKAVERWSRAGRQPVRWPTRRAMRTMVEQSGLRVVSQRRLIRLPAGPLLPPVLTIAERP